MQTILFFAIVALVAGAAVDSASIAGDKSVAKRDLWQSLAEVSSHMAGVQSYGAAPLTTGWSRSGLESRMIVPDHHHQPQYQGTGPSAEQLRVSSHPVHEWHQEEQEQEQSSDEWRPRHHTFSSSISKETSKDERTHVEIEHEQEAPKHEKEKEHHHHHHHHVKVIEVPKPYTVHVEKPYPVYVEKPVIVEKHVPLKLIIKKKYHH